MLRSNMGLVLGGIAAMALGTAGGWMLLAGKPVQASARTSVTVERTNVPVTIAAPRADEAAQPARLPGQTAAPKPTAPASPARTAEVPSPAPPAPTPDAAPAEDSPGKPRIRLDGERSEISFDGDQGGLHVNKDRLSVRTPFGKFKIDW